MIRARKRRKNHPLILSSYLAPIQSSTVHRPLKNKGERNSISSFCVKTVRLNLAPLPAPSYAS